MVSQQSPKLLFQVRILTPLQVYIVVPRLQSPSAIADGGQGLHVALQKPIVLTDTLLVGIIPLIQTY